ncbi:MAG TPA: hypothetical protein VMW56_00860 [Candidatus Margulisiibacteriota bacterium]|nr:hypothetical protein [Candidatus Margulisiibacteriota bacterium]
MVHPPAWSVEEVAALRGFTVEWADGDGYLVSRRAQLFHTAALRPPRQDERVLIFPRALPARLLGQYRLGQRLLRSLFYNVVRLPSGDLFLTFAKQIALYRRGTLMPVSGLRRPFRVLRGGAAVDREGNVYFGEYHSNEEREEVRIYCLPAGTSKAEVAHTFPAGHVRHVHGVFWEARRERLWCTSGDRGRENRICVTDDGFRTLTEVGAGDESWRCVGLSFGPTELLYGTDAEFEPNNLYCLDMSTGARTCLGPVDGPVYYAIRRGNAHFFGTTAEGCPSQAINAASIWCVTGEAKPVRLVTYRKDVWPNAFMYGTLHFALGPQESPGVLCSLHGLANQDERTILIRSAG